MRKIGLTLLTLTIVLAACGEVPTAASANDARAAMDGGLETGSYEEGGPGFLGSGHATAPEGEQWMTTAGNPGFGGSGN
jgi:hypothetical protein